MRHPELPERDDAPDRLGVLARVDVLRLEARAVRVRPARAGKRRLDGFARRADDAPVQARNRDLVAGLRDGVLRLAVKRRIRLLQKFVGGGGRLNVRAMVDEIPDRDARRELGHAAKMIAVPVRRDQVVDLREAGVLDGGHDAVGVADRGRAAVSPNR